MIEVKRGGIWRAAALFCALGVPFGTLACASGDRLGQGETAETEGPTASVEVALTTVPPSALCIRITATPSSGTATVKTTTVTAGSSSANISVGKLLPGNYTVTGDAFNVACTSITGAGDWIADPASVTMKAGVSASLTLTFRKNNPLNANANFVNNVLSVATNGGTTFVNTEGGLLESGQMPNNRAFARMSFTAFDATSVPGNAVAQVGGTYNGACAARVDGTVWCWGSNINGELGSGIGILQTSATPVQVPGLTGVTQLATGAFHTCAVGTFAGNSNSVFCWGQNADGELGNGTTTSSSTPVLATTAIVKTLACGANSTYAVAGSGGIVLAWGDNAFGQLGDGSTLDRVTPVQVSGESAVQAVTAGYAHACTLRVDGSVRCFGHNGFGQLGNGTTTNSSTPVLVSGATQVRQIAAGLYHNCVINGANQTLCWGYNSYGQLGDGTATTRTVPTLASLNGVTLTQLAAGAYAYQTCGLSSTLDVYCWGDNSVGQLGVGSLNGAFVPTRGLLQ